MELNPSKNRLVETAVILIFLTALFTPFLLWTFQKDVLYSEVEKRELHPFPHLSAHDSIVDYTRSFDTYFQDHFGMREWLIRRYHREINKRFGMSGVPLVLEGRDGWLYFIGERLLDDLKGKLNFSPRETLQFQHILEAKEKWLNQRKIAYIFMVAPNKQSIYPEYLPQHYQQLETTSRLDNLLAGLAGEKNSLPLDVRPHLRQNKPANRLYDKTDTHWNSLGALQAYETLMERVHSLFPDFHSRENFSFMPDWQEGTGGDLAIMLGREQTTIEQRPVLNTAGFNAEKKPLAEKFAVFLRPPQLKPFYTENPKGRLRVLILHDSFFNMINPFSSESFQEAFYVWQYYDTTTLEFFNRKNLSTLLDMYQPDLVIEETVERFLPYFLKTNAWFSENTVQPENPAETSGQK